MLLAIISDTKELLEKKSFHLIPLNTRNFYTINIQIPSFLLLLIHFTSISINIKYHNVFKFPMEDSMIFTFIFIHRILNLLLEFITDTE